ncbi:MAG: carbohydrate-binding domain-containing protein [Bacilli bacterium]
MNKKKMIILIVFIVILVFCLILLLLNNRNDVNESKDINMDIDADNGDEKIDWSMYSTYDITLNESITITKEGIYNLSGTINDGNITIDSSGNVKLILNNVNIKSSDGPTIYVKNAENVLVYLEKDSINTLEDSDIYSSTYNDIDGTLFSKSDLIFDGTGTLIIKSNYQDAIVSKDDLKIKNGNFIINSIDDGIRGKDSVYILNGIFDITSGGDGIKSTNDTDSDKGFILVENGTFEINSTLDGISAETKILIKNGTFTITSGGGSINVSTNDDWGMWGRETNKSSLTNINSNSAKGIKCKDNLIIENGTFVFDTSDDAIHSNNYIGIIDGDINISSGDDGIHADKKIIIDDGNINIVKSYEGIESSEITINNGNISIVSTDDGINVAGGNDSSATDRKGANNYNLSSNNILTINGGIIHVDSVGDGIDVNGSGYVNGGNIIVEGPENNNNGGLDYDGLFEVNKGILIVSGSSGMAQSISSGSKQYNIMIYFSQNITAADTVTIVDENSNEILNYTSSKNYSALVFSSDKLINNNKYTIKINNEEYQSFTISDITTLIGRNTGMGDMPGNGGGPKPSGRR